MERGSTLDGCTMLHTTDDLINFNGLWGYIEKVSGRTITLHRDSEMPAHPGDRLHFYDAETGAPLGSAVVESAKHLELTLDRDAAPLDQAVAENPRWQNNGWEVHDCGFRDCYQRFLIQGSHVGTLRNCRFTRIGSGIVLASNFENSGKPRALSGKTLPQEDTQPVLLKQSEDFVVKDNRL